MYPSSLLLLVTLGSASAYNTLNELPAYIKGINNHIEINCLCKWASGDYFLGGNLKGKHFSTSEPSPQAAFSLRFNKNSYLVEKGKWIDSPQITVEEVVSCSNEKQANS